MTDTPLPADPVPGPPARDLDRPVVAFGVALLAAAVVLSAFYARARPELDWSTYAVGLLATAGLLGVSLAAGLGVLVPRRIDEATDLVAWPGAFGAVAVGLMIAVAVDDTGTAAYVGGGAVVVLSLAGIALTRRGPFVVSGVAGLFIVNAQLFDDVVGVDGDTPSYWPAGLGLLLFAVVVTAAGWGLPTRVLSGITSGAIAVAGFASLTGVLAVTGVIGAAFAGTGDEMEYRDYVGDFDYPDITSDTWAVLVMALLLMVGWTCCAVATGHVGFRILVVAMAVAVAPMAVVALQVEHPTWWGVGLAAVGGATLLAAFYRSSAAGRERAPGMQR